MSEKVTLIVKAANQSFLDQRIECSLDWSVQSLKEEISKIHPAKPAVQEQRLIYSGQLLQDSFLLRGILRHPSDNNEYIIHLVCSSNKTNTNTKWPQSRPAPVITPLIASENNTYPEALSDLTTDGIRRRVVTPEQPSPSSGIQPELDISTSPQLPQILFPFSPSTDPIQQMAVMQQMYAQYMASYMQYIQSGNVESTRLFQETPTSPPVAPLPQAAASIPPEIEDPHNTTPPQAQAPNNANEQEAQRNPQMRVNPQVGVGGEDEDGVAPRDWLDYIYFGSRMIVLLSIVYFYSTLVRFLVVACATIFIYLYQCGCLRLWRVEDLPRPTQEPPQPPSANQGAEDDGTGAHPNAPSPHQSDGEADDHAGNAAAASSREALQEEGERESITPPLEGATRAEVEEGAQNVAEGQQQQPSSSTARNPIMEDLPPHQPTLLALSWTFLTTFFTSLIPEQHQIV